MSFLSVGSIQRARRLHDLRQSISHGPPMPRCGSAGSRGLFPATSSPHTARARCVLNSTARPRRIGKPFSHLRAKELRPGGRLVVVLPALADDGSSGFTPLFDEANAALEEMVTDGVITSEERSRMVLDLVADAGVILLAPFAANGKFRQLTRGRLRDVRTSQRRLGRI